MIYIYDISYAYLDPIIFSLLDPIIQDIYIYISRYDDFIMVYIVYFRKPPYSFSAAKSPTEIPRCIGHRSFCLAAARPRSSQRAPSVRDPTWPGEKTTRQNGRKTREKMEENEENIENIE